jgi:hypothetical protein
MIGRPECKKIMDYDNNLFCFPEVCVSGADTIVVEGENGCSRRRLSVGAAAAVVGLLKSKKNQKSKVVEKNKPQKNIINTTVLYIYIYGPTNCLLLFLGICDVSANHWNMTIKIIMLWVQNPLNLGHWGVGGGEGGRNK